MKTKHFMLACAIGALSTSGARAVPIAYTFEVGNVGNIIGEGEFTGSLGSVPIDGFNDYVIFTFIGDTTTINQFSFQGVHGYENLVGIGFVTVTDLAGGVLASGTFPKSDKMFVSVDNVNGGLGFGSMAVPPPLPFFPYRVDFPGDPVNPFGIAVDHNPLVLDPNIDTYDLTLTEANGQNAFFAGDAVSCHGFPSKCDHPISLPTSAGLLTLDVPEYNDFATFSASQTVAPSVPVPEPSTWAMMLLGFAGLGFAGYHRAREQRAVV